MSILVARKGSINRSGFIIGRAHGRGCQHRRPFDFINRTKKLPINTSEGPTKCTQQPKQPWKIGLSIRLFNPNPRLEEDTAQLYSAFLKSCDPRNAKTLASELGGFGASAKDKETKLRTLDILYSHGLRYPEMGVIGASALAIGQVALSAPEIIIPEIARLKYRDTGLGYKARSVRLALVEDLSHIASTDKNIVLRRLTKEILKSKELTLPQFRKNISILLNIPCDTLKAYEELTFGPETSAQPSAKTEAMELEPTASDQSYPSSPAMVIKGFNSLVHPLYIGDPPIIPNNTEFAGDGRLELAIILAFRYMKKAISLLENEIMVVFLHRSRSDLKEGKTNEAKFLRTLVAALRLQMGERVLIMYKKNPDDNSFLVFDESGPNQIKEELTKRGFKLDTSAMAFTYGEQLACCVLDAASSVNQAFDFRQRGLVLTELTSGAFYWKTHPRIREEVAKQLKNEGLNYSDT